VRRIVPQGEVRDRVIDEAPYVSHLLAHSQDGLAHALVAWSAMRDGHPLVRLADLGADLATAWSVDIELEVLGAFIGAVPHDGAFVAGLRAGNQDALVRFDRDGLREPIVFAAPDAPIGLERLLSGPGGLVMILTGDDGALYARRLDAAYAEIGIGRYAVDGRVVVVIDATLDGDGSVRALVSNVIPEGGSDERWLRFDADLRLVADMPAPFVGSMATLFDGSSLVSSGAGLVRISPTGRLGIPHPLGLDFVPLDRLGVATTFDEGFVVAHRRFDPERGQELRIVRTDRLGFTSCGAAGLCLGALTAEACDTAGLCESRGCDPDTGACAGGPIPLCRP